MFFKAHAAGAIFSIFLFASCGCQAEDRVPSAFVNKDEWEFQQVRESPGQKREVNPEIRFTVAKLKETWIAHARAVTNNNVPVWDLKWKLPKSSCLQDFVGRSDFGLLVSCGRPLVVGMAWDDETVDGGEKTVSKYLVESKEDITVIAGRFATIKIVESGNVFDHQSGRADRLTLKVKSTYWFSHEAKAFVRIVREYLTPEGERHLLLSEELKSFKVHASEE